MLKKKCPSCSKKIQKKFSYCPHCGVGFKVRNDGNDFGMIGRSDSVNRPQNELKLPLGMGKIMNSLVKQLESQLGNMDIGNLEGMPKNVKIRVARGPGMGQVVEERAEKKMEMPAVSDAENERRSELPRVEVESKVRRLADSIIYEIDTPGVKKKSDIVLTELATGLEIRAYSKDKCYVKFIPLKVEVVRYSVEREKVIVEIRG
jgi:HSP20 family molecular chaperone IbpA